MKHRINVSLKAMSGKTSSAKTQSRHTPVDKNHTHQLPATVRVSVQLVGGVTKTKAALNQVVKKSAQAGVSTKGSAWRLDAANSKTPPVKKATTSHVPRVKTLSPPQQHAQIRTHAAIFLAVHWSSSMATRLGR